MVAIGSDKEGSVSTPKGAVQKMPTYEVIDRFFHGCYKVAWWFGLRRALQRVVHRTGKQWRFPSDSRECGVDNGVLRSQRLKGAFLLPLLNMLNHGGADEPNHGKTVMEYEENLGLGTLGRNERQVLTGVNRLHSLILGIREGSADGDAKEYSH